MSRRHVRRMRETIKRALGRLVPRTWALASIACLGLVLALASAAAAAPWAAPVTVGANATSYPTIGITGNGTALLSARFAANAHRFPVGKLRLFTGLHGSRFKSVTTFGGQVFTYRTYGRSRAILVLRRVLARDRNYVETVRLSYRFGTAAGHFGAAHTLWTGKLYDEPVIAATGSGAIALAWTEYHGDTRRVWIAVRPRGGHFGRARVLVGSGGPSNPSVAWGSAGNLLVAFARDDRRPHHPAVRDVAVRVQRGGHSFGPVRAIGPSQGLTAPVAGFAPTGQMYVAWGTQDTGEEANEPWRVYAASASSPRHRFGTAQVLEPGGANLRPAGRVALTVGRDGTATAGWSAALAGGGTASYPARVAGADPRGRFGAAQQLSANAAMQDLALGPDGTLLAIFSTLAADDWEQGQQVFAALRAPGASRFGAPEAVSPVERARDARAAFDARTGRPTVVWIGQPGADPLGPPNASEPTALRASTRQP